MRTLESVARISWAASTPLLPGIFMSMMMMSGRKSFAASTASTPLDGLADRGEGGSEARREKAHAVPLDFFIVRD
jgi:hypothetical protein